MIAALHQRNVTALWVSDARTQTTSGTVSEIERRQHHQQRLTRLFRQSGASGDERYLRELMTRYRGAEPS